MTGVNYTRETLMRVSVHIIQQTRGARKIYKPEHTMSRDRVTIVHTSVKQQADTKFGSSISIQFYTLVYCFYNT